MGRELTEHEKRELAKPVSIRDLEVAIDWLEVYEDDDDGTFNEAHAAFRVASMLRADVARRQSRAARRGAAKELSKTLGRTITPADVARALKAVRK